MKKKEAIGNFKYLYKIYSEDDGYYPPLCDRWPLFMNIDWYRYWSKINNKRYVFMKDYFNDYKYSNFEIGLLRLLVAHQFIEETYKD